VGLSTHYLYLESLHAVGVAGFGAEHAFPPELHAGQRKGRVRPAGSSQQHRFERASQHRRIVVRFHQILVVIVVVTGGVVVVIIAIPAVSLAALALLWPFCRRALGASWWCW